MTTGPSSLPPSEGPGVVGGLENARRALLDLSRRNRLLNFKPRGHGSLAIVDELPGQIYRTLVDEGATMQFLPIEEAPEGAEVGEAGTEAGDASETAPAADVAATAAESPSAVTAAETASPEGGPEGAEGGATAAGTPSPPLPPLPESGDAAEDSDAGAPTAGVNGRTEADGESPAASTDSPAMELGEIEESAASAEPADAAHPAPRHTDRRLQTALPGPKLQERLLHLSRQAESALEEQGVNVLYLTIGLVEWTDGPGSAVRSRAPLIMIPVELTRRSIHGRHALRHSGDDPVLNPTLVELCKRNFRLELPAFDSDAEGGIDAYLAAVEETLAPIAGWSLLREVHLGLFSFAKLLMYLDLDDARWPADRAVSRHRLVSALLGQRALADDSSEPFPEPRALDQMLSPTDTFQVLDADSSQQAAIVAAKQGRSLVIEGPPGTGKSQTITNIIAECLAEGKTVLFVAEKAAALEVVKSRLEHVGLGDFVAELHSRKANKRAFMEDLQRTLARDFEPPTKRELVGAERLAELRRRLNDYVADLHRPEPPLNLTPFVVIGRAAELADAPEAVFDLPDVASWDPARLREAEERVGALAAAAERTGPAAMHPWRGAGLTELPLTVRQQLPMRLRAGADAAAALAAIADALRDQLSLAPPLTPAAADEFLALAAAILADPPVEASHARNPAWDSPGTALAAIADLKKLAAIRRDLAARWNASAEEVDWTLVAQRRISPPGLLGRLFSGQWRADTRLIRAHLKPGVSANDPQIAQDLGRLVEARRLRDALAGVAAKMHEFVGDRWKGDASDPDALEAYARAVARLRSILSRSLGEPAALEKLCTAAGRAALQDHANAMTAELAKLRGAWSDAAAMLHADGPPFLGASPDLTPWETWRARLAECLDSPESLDDWSARNRARTEAAAAGLLPLLTWADSSDVPPGEWPRAFLRQFYRLWLDHVTRSRPALATFRGQDHEKVIERFREVDKQWLEVSRQRLCAQIYERRPRVGFATSESSGLGILEREIRRKRGIRPIRQLLASPAGAAVQRIKPCFMMSPLSVAQFLEPGGLRFDVVIFDEASQVEPADALGAIARAEQVILVGDEKQLPPTNFFNAIGAATDDASADDGEGGAPAADLESILGLGQASIPARTRLRWHYRSRHQSLIDFSNREFYDHDLRVFPSPYVGGGTHGLRFRFIENAVYLRGKGQHNPVEARAVAEAVIEHARTTPELSLGVAALNARQQNAILDELERLRRELDDPDVERFFAADRAEPLFVKNLETVQGDERDVMFLSIGFGRDDAGRLTMNFGPINQEGGWRRLNVLVTRARQCCTVFSSIRPEDIRLTENSPRGVRALKNYLHYAITGSHDHTTGPGGDHQSPFEAQVARALRERGWEVHPQIGSAGFWVDLGIADPEAPGRYLAGIECDGATYHSSATARDRDRLRQAVLEGLGWTILRVWSTDWFHQPRATIDRLHEQLERVAKRRPAPRSPRPEPPRPSSVQQPPQQQRQAPANNGSGAGAGEGGAIPPGFVPYQRFRPSRRSSSKPISEQTQRSLASLLAEAAAVEGPIHRDVLFRLIARLLDSRLTQSAVAALEAALGAAEEESRLTRRGDFIWPAGMTAPPLRWRAVEDAVTDPDHIAPEEAAAAAAWVVQHEFGVPEADLPAAVVRAMGLRRVTEPNLRLARAGVEFALATGLIAKDERGLMTTPPRPPSPAA